MCNHNDGAGQERNFVLPSRRELLAVGAGLAVAHLITGVGTAAASPGPAGGKEPLKVRKLGGLEVSELGFGNWA